MTITNWSASVFTADLRTRVDVTARLLDFTGIVRNLATGEWTATLTASSLTDLLTIWPGTDAPLLGFGIQVPGQIVMSGAINTVTRERSSSGDKLTLAGVDEFAALDTRDVFPQPADLPPWTTSATQTVTGQASTAITQLIRSQIGDTARAERRMPGLAVFDSAVGETGTWEFRLDRLSEAVAKIADETGLTVYVRRRSDAGLDVTIGAALDRTNIVLDDTVLGDSTLVLSAATATTIVAGGAGEGTSRLFAIAGDGGTISGVARREAFVDRRNIASQPALQRAANAERAAASAATTFTGSLSNEAADIYLWRRDYDLGDKLTLRLGTSTWTVQVTGVNVTIDGTGLHLSPVLGTAPKHALAQLLRDVGNLSARVNSLEVS